MKKLKSIWKGMPTGAEDIQYNFNELEGAIAELNFTTEDVIALTHVAEKEVTIPVSANVTSGTARFRRQGNMVVLALDFNLKKGNGWDTLLAKNKIPAGYRWDNEFFVNTTAESTSHSGEFAGIYCNATGIRTITATTIAGGNFQASIVYMTKDTFPIADAGIPVE